jgi:hypothetical protein
MTIYFEIEPNVIARQIETAGALLSVRKMLIIVVVVILNKEKLGQDVVIHLFLVEHKRRPQDASMHKV